MYSRVRDFRVGSVQVSLFSIPRDVVLADWKLRLFPGGNGDIRWDGFGLVVYQFGVFLLKHLALVDEAGPLESPLCWLAYPCVRRMAANLLNLVACVSFLMFCLVSRAGGPVVVSSSRMGVAFIRVQRM